MATGKTPARYTVLTYNSIVVVGYMSLTGAGQNFGEVDLTDLTSAQKFVGAGIPECKITIKGKADNTATTGEYAVFTASAVYGNSNGAPLFIDFGVRAVPTTGDVRLSNTLMWVSSYKRDATGVAGALEFEAILSTAPGSVFSWTTKP